jgi:outer membrane protein assembly factor BamB
VVDSVAYVMLDWGQLSDVSVDDGKILRTVMPPEQGSYESPVVESQDLYLACGNSNLTALSLPDLQVTWSTYVFPPDSVSGSGVHPEWILSVPFVSESGIFFTSQEGFLYALDRNTGAFRWRYSMGVSVATPCAAEGVAYAAGFDSVLMAVDVQTGAALWQLPLPEAVEFGGPQYLNGLLYLAGSGGTVFCVDPGVPEILWSADIGVGFRTSVSVDAGVVCAADASGVFALDPKTGALLWVNRSGGESPLVTEARVYCVSRQAGLLVLEASTGREIAVNPEITNGFFSTPVVLADRVLIAGRGTLYCLGKAPIASHEQSGKGN